MDSDDQVTKPLSASGLILKGRYSIERELGRGGFGIVYLARDRDLLSKPVVIKILTQDYDQNAWALKKFHQEMEALSRIDHPGVIGALDTGQTADGRPFLVMQYVEGVNLRSQIAPPGMDLARAASIVRQIGQALSAAHDKGVWHRDLKPENVMLQTSGGEEFVKLIDFGIAAIKDSQFAADQQATQVAGSFSYMSPEQFQNKPCAQSDVYAMGILAFEMLTASKPFSDTSLYQLMQEQQTGPPSKPRDLRSDLPEAAEQAVLKALAWDSTKRYQSPREFGQAFAQACTTPAAAGAQGPATTQRRPDTPGRLELAHVLFLDLVGYSMLPMDKQAQCLDELQQVVRETAAFQTAEEEGNLLRLPTGDGMALIFFRDPVAPVQCAIEVGRRLRSKPHLRLRTGIHTGPVLRIADINTNMNVAGGGINMAQRVMDCGDAGHILVSGAVADVLRQLSEWTDLLHDLGEHPVKHGVLARIYNLCTPEAGNPDVPTKLAKAEKEPRTGSRRAVVVALGAVALTAAITAGVWIWRKPGPPPAPQILRTLSYSITLQKYSGDRPEGPPAQLPGEMIFTPDHRIALNVASPESGHLYILNEGPLDAAGTISFNVLFPDLAPGSTSLVPANRQVRFPKEDWIVFDQQQGTEKLYLVWSEDAIAELEQAASGSVGDVINNVVVIQDPEQKKVISSLLASLAEANRVERDDEARQTTVRSTARALAHLVRLEHH